MQSEAREDGAAVVVQEVPEVARSVAWLPHQPLTADECKVVEAAIAAIVKTFEIDRTNDDSNVDTDATVQSLAAVAVQLIRRGCEPSRAVTS